MLGNMHQHIVEELQQSARTDTVFVVTAVIFNLVVLAVNAGVASDAASNGTNTAANDVTLVIFMLMTILVNSIAVIALNTGKQTRSKLLNGVLHMYADEGIDKYYDSSLLMNYNRRYVLFIGVILCLAATAVLVPLVIRFL